MGNEEVLSEYPEDVKGFRDTGLAPRRRLNCRSRGLWDCVWKGCKA